MCAESDLDYVHYRHIPWERETLSSYCVQILNQKQGPSNILKKMREAKSIKQKNKKSRTLPYTTHRVHHSQLSLHHPLITTGTKAYTHTFINNIACGHKSRNSTWQPTNQLAKKRTNKRVCYVDRLDIYSQESVVK